MKLYKYNIFVFVLAFYALSLTAYAQKRKVKLEVIASTEKQWTGIAVSKNERIFVNFPKWSDNVPVSVAEIINGKAVAFPADQSIFVAVQAVVIDAKNRLWVVDTRNPQFQGVMDEGPVLYQFNLENNSKEKAYGFPKGVFQPNSYFNDVRIDTKNEVAYLTDSGNGALIVLDLKSGKSKRVLDHHSSTESEVDYLICNDIKWENTVHSDGIALTPNGKYLYYVALTGHTLYRIPTSALIDASLSDKMLARKVEKVATIPATDGMMFDQKGNLWLGGLEDNSINLLKKDGSVHKVIKDKIIRWADSFSKGKNGSIYFTTAQIHLPENQRKKYQVLKLSK
ncbi:hypothetical protein EMN47_09800 [Prolixibacteraceae bacterium JC049]|nr:hypothetical protein [Prolixibacteraceae bacterium JC049]